VTSPNTKPIVIVNQSNVSAVSYSDVGDQYMFITILTDFQYVNSAPNCTFPKLKTTDDKTSLNVGYYHKRQLASCGLLEYKA